MRVKNIKTGKEYPINKKTWEAMPKDRQGQYQIIDPNDTPEVTQTVKNEVEKPVKEEKKAPVEQPKESK